MKEQPSHSPLVSELLSIMPSQSPEDIYRKTELVSTPDVIESVALSYRKLRLEIEHSGSEIQREKTKKDPIFRLTRMIVDVYPDLSAEPIKKLMVEKYGFSDVEVKKFGETDESNAALNKLFFDYIAYLEGAYLKSEIGRHFERPLGHRFREKSRLDMIRAGRGHEVLEHLQELSI